MYKTTVKTAIFVGMMTLLTTGCNDNTKAKVIQSEPVATQTIKEKTESKSVETPQVKNMAKEAADVVYSVFQDTAKIGPKGNYMVLVFGTNTCPYCMKLKEDIFKSEKFQNRLKNDFSSYYLKTHENLRHKLFHENEYMDVDTKTMISIYGVQGTPTIIFTDKAGKAVIMVPGYMPTKQFLVTLDFMDSKKWMDKDRKNGEVYQALKDFYIEKGIKVNK